MKASVTTLVSASVLILLCGPTSAAAAPRGLRGDLSQTEVCINPPQCVVQDDCCCGYVCAVSSIEDPLAACYPVNNAFCPPTGPIHKTKHQKNGFMGCINPDRCLHETDCCCGFSCVTKIGAEKHRFLDPVCAAVYDGRCPPEYEEADLGGQVNTPEVNGKEVTLGIPDALFGVGEHSEEYKEYITEDESTVMDCRTLGNVCDIFHRCCVGYSCIDQHDSIIKDPMRKGFCKIVMVEELRR